MSDQELDELFWRCHGLLSIDTFRAAVREAVARETKRLVDALRVVQSHVEELEDAWRRGALANCDGQGGLRSNRNAAVRVEVSRLVAEYGPTP